MMPQPPCSRLVRWHVHRVVDNIYMRIFGLLLVIIDVILVFVRLGETGWKLNSDADPPVRTGVVASQQLLCNPGGAQGFEAASTCIVIYFMVELLARVFAVGYALVEGGALEFAFVYRPVAARSTTLASRLKCLMPSSSLSPSFSSSPLRSDGNHRLSGNLSPPIYHFCQGCHPGPTGPHLSHPALHQRAAQDQKGGTPSGK